MLLWNFWNVYGMKLKPLNDFFCVCKFRHLSSQNSSENFIPWYLRIHDLVSQNAFVVLACLELQKRVPVYHLVVKNDFSCPRSVFVVCSRQFSDFLRRRARENFGRNSRYLRIPGNRLYLRMRGRKGADPRAPRQPKAHISNFTEVLPGFYYRPQRIMDSVPFCGVPKSR